MDSLSYKYNAGTNQLNHVRDNVPDNDYPSTGYQDIDNQSPDNYAYDETGNLIKDDAENVTDIEGNVYGKITKQTFATTTVGATVNVYYYYDAAGNRMGKRNEIVASTGTSNNYLWYASGNVMATYNSNPSTGNTVPNTLSVKERHLFGSSRLGIFTLKKDVKATPPSYTQTIPYNRSWIRGYKSYELSNHLGNVLSTITDIKFGVDTNSDGIIDYYTADVAGASDYYPFGATLPNRSTGTSYRYGFNGKEKDKEGTTQYDYGFRIYDPRLGRFKSVDPLSSSYPWNSTYAFAENDVNRCIDLDGLEKYYVTNYWKNGVKQRTEIEAYRDVDSKNVINMQFKLSGAPLTDKDVVIYDIHDEGSRKERISQSDAPELTKEQERILTKAFILEKISSGKATIENLLDNDVKNGEVSSTQGLLHQKALVNYKITEE